MEKVYSKDSPQIHLQITLKTSFTTYNFELGQN